MAATDEVAARARTLREAAGTLSGVGLGEEDSTPQRDVRADVIEAFGEAKSLHWQLLAEQLAQRFPEQWAGATSDAVRSE